MARYVCKIGIAAILLVSECTRVFSDICQFHPDQRKKQWRSGGYRG